jgi:small nuclear ribonucleoprotein (snRNP)-like protein
LDEYRQKSVIVSLKDKNVIKGILKAFDVHINVVLEIDNKTLFIRGDEVLSIENE